MTAQAEESLRTLQDPATLSIDSSKNHSPTASWAENSILGLSANSNESLPLDDTWAFLTDTQWTGPQLQSMDLLADGILGSQVPGRQRSSPSVRETEPTHNGEEADVDKLLPPNVLNEMYTKFFDKAHSGYFMMDKNRFLSRLADSQANSEMQSLKLIILAHGASLSSAQADLARKFYELSRKEFEKAELGKGFLTLTALQSCIFLAQFELKQTMFARAWTNISRVNWMVRMFGLHNMDGNTTFPKAYQERRYHLPPTTDVWELEERRRTFWAAFQISCFVSINKGWETHIPTIYADVTTFLPANDAPSSLSRLNLYDAFRLSGSRELSTNNALILISGLHNRCLFHVTHAIEEGKPGSPTYDFWMHHYRISENIKRIASGAAPTAASLLPNEPNAFCLNISVQAIVICLNYAETMHVAGAKVPRSPHPLCENSKCQNSALAIANMSRKLMGHADLAKMSNYVPWSIYVAAQACIRTLNANTFALDAIHESRSPRSASPSSPFDTWTWAPSSNEGSWEAATNQITGATSATNLFSSAMGPLSSSPSLLTPRGIGTTVFPESGSVVNRSVLQEALNSLVDAMVALMQISPLVGVFEAELREELSGGKLLTDQRLIGFVGLPLGGQHLQQNDIGSLGDMGWDYPLH
ncbi:uncharacterized protein K452DRAFT_301724 [Aplosporella prunicola CBS 121167]|uniref:Xylanolytic transcriptional activator regulatory domain-containing protein n=1 Tax=Aplosporella prunicola CBS 121167 TaxID=1176127 RepID=A0A6A6B138_9PEZI|nr:uncharacterized protein K452DRAFT_301724 [Aplosporella prunicola CBS 121167]KAF2137750.1 hypothetical protein K452DRAFT_301724 [Aplosporella prunicola CBS 121167]